MFLLIEISEDQAILRTQSELPQSAQSFVVLSPERAWEMPLFEHQERYLLLLRKKIQPRKFRSLISCIKGFTN